MSGEELFIPFKKEVPVDTNDYQALKEKLTEIRDFVREKERRYFLNQDSSAHWYVIPVERKEEWYAFTEIDDDDPTSWDTPSWAESIDRPESITFTNWRHYGS